MQKSKHWIQSNSYGKCLQRHITLMRAMLKTALCGVLSSDCIIPSWPRICLLSGKVWAYLHTQNITKI